mmetsp:Transcript_18580/g.56075  ORF Transcript_18580/g.56075 Transcript_18580/m.56075 type:complete len:155 (+) Transcript_18580:266-730(+)|eukprot:scaffold50558_cov30-Tisochrysis_lutea.AAC.12
MAVTLGALLRAAKEAAEEPGALLRAAEQRLAAELGAIGESTSKLGLGASGSSWLCRGSGRACEAAELGGAIGEGCGLCLWPFSPPPLTASPPARSSPRRRESPLLASAAQCCRASETPSCIGAAHTTSTSSTPSSLTGPISRARKLELGGLAAE